jgi:predicted DNA-binding ribbon-helix-helix protein
MVHLYINAETAMPQNANAQDAKSPHRLSVSLTAEQHRELNEIAQRNKVSIAWVIREAIERLLKDDLPLLHVGKE